MSLKTFNYKSRILLPYTWLDPPQKYYIMIKEERGIYSRKIKKPIFRKFQLHYSFNNKKLNIIKFTYQQRYGWLKECHLVWYYVVYIDILVHFSYSDYHLFTRNDLKERSEPFCFNKSFKLKMYITFVFKGMRIELTLQRF